MEKSKKIFLIILCIFGLLILITLAREIIINNNGILNKSNPMSQEEIVSLLEKGSTDKNYYYSPEQVGVNDNTSKVEYYIKDNIEVQYIDSNLQRWVNYNTGEGISLWNIQDGKRAVITNKEKKPEYQQCGFDYSVIINNELYKNECEYLGEKELNGRTVIVIQMTQKGFSRGVTKFTIDKETGIILEREDLTKILFITIHKSKCDRNVKFDVVTDEDIERPDLSEYIIVK